MLEERHGGQQECRDSVLVQELCGPPREGFRELVSTDWVLRLVVDHPFPGGLVVLCEFLRFEVLPGRVADDPLERVFLGSLEPRLVIVESVCAKDISVPERGELPVGLGEVRGVDVVEEREHETELGDLARVLIHVNAEDVVPEECSQFCWPESATEFLSPLFRQLAVALNEKGARPARGVQDTHA